MIRSLLFIGCNNIMKYVSIFGSYKTDPKSEEYRVAYDLSIRLAKKGYIIKNGGGSGIMEASTRGALDAGGSSIGYVLKKFSKKNQQEERMVYCESLFERLKNLIEGSSAFVLFSGGTGTLAELSLCWELMNKGLISILPIICYKDFWKPVIELFKGESNFVSKDAVSLINFADSVDEIMMLIK